MKLLEGLNIIEKKLAKESDSSRSESHKSSEEKGEVKISSRNHHHHRHSHKRVGNNSSLSPVRRYKRSGVDELRGEMNKIKPPTFDGEHKKDEDVETWLSRHEEVFSIA
jgi:hypothetical protein